DFAAARSQFERALESDPNFALGHSQLAKVLHVMGYDDRAQHEARRALELADRLTPDERLQIQARLFAAQKEWDKAANLYKTLCDRYPDEIEHALGYSSALRFGGHPKEAFAVLERARATPGAADDARIDLSEAGAAQAVNDFARELAAGRRAADKARAHAANGLLAEAAYYTGDALQALGKIDEALPALDEARNLYQTLGDRGGVA